jgi:hypothetical protein
MLNKADECRQVVVLQNVKLEPNILTPSKVTSLRWYYEFEFVTVAMLVPMLNDLMEKNINSMHTN